MTRQEINREIIKILSDFNESEPDLRFGQLLAITKVLTYKDASDIDLRSIKGSEVFDPFYDESITTLLRMKSNIKLRASVSR